MAQNPPSLSLPQELMLEIFSRLPEKTIGKCKCLSKSHHSLISNPHFLNLCLTHKQNLILITPSHSLHLLLSTPILNNYAVSRKLDFPVSWTQVVGSCNDLVLLTDNVGDLFLVNPVTCVMSKIPSFELSLNKDQSDRTHGFGYDAISNDYKVVTLSYFKNRNRGGICSDTFVDVYYVKTGVWRRVGTYTYERLMVANDPLLMSGVFVDGGIHWLDCGRVWNRRSLVVRFDLADEEFYGLEAPESLVVKYRSLVGRGGRLCVVPSYDRRGGDVWTMEEYATMEEVGLLESWKRFKIPENRGWPEVKAVCFVGEEGVVMRTEDGRLFVYDVEKKTMKEFVVDGVPASCMEMGIGNFVGGLV